MSSKDKEKEKKDKFKELEEKATANLAGWQKALADYQNLQKETDKKIADLEEMINSARIFELLPIFDNYQTALDHIPGEQKKESWAQGLEHILKMWETFLADHKVEKIKALGEKFDPLIHESIGQVSNDKEKDQIVVEEKQIGYRTKDRLIRPAKVIINNYKQI